MAFIEKLYLFNLQLQMVTYKYNRVGCNSQTAIVSLVVERYLLLNHVKGSTPHNCTKSSYF
jgi:hypothetical protein